MSLLFNIQQSLKVPKNQFNKFGGYNYRSAEDILEAVKKVAKDYNAWLIINDEIINVGEFNYVKATVTISNGQETYSASALAREEVSKKGMDSAQVTGSTSSYARKYAMNALFCLDDTKDPDATNTHDKTPPVQAYKPVEPSAVSHEEWAKQIKAIPTIEKLQEFYFENEKTIMASKALLQLINVRKTEFNNGN